MVSPINLRLMLFFGLQMYFLYLKIELFDSKFLLNISNWN